MFLKLITFFMTIALSFVSGFAQKSDTLPTKSQEQKEKENQIKSQAINILKDNLSKNKSIVNLNQRSDVVAEASSALWEYDATTAKESLIAFIDQLIKDFNELSAKEKRSKDESTQMWNLEAAIKKCLKTLAAKDVKEANLLQNRYFKIREENLKVKNLGEQFEMAAAGLEADEQRTIAILSAIIQQGIPSQFPDLVYGIRDKNPRVADLLIKRAIQNLNTASHYKTSDTIYLSVAVFSESQGIIPWMDDIKKPNNCGIMYLSTGIHSKLPANPENVSAFFAVFPQFFESRIVNQTGNVLATPLTLLESFFIVEKLRAYAAIYPEIDTSVLDRLQIVLTPAMQEAGFTEKTIGYFKVYASRIATSEDPSPSDDGASAFERAENAKTPEEKLEFMTSGIIQLLQYRQFEKAERKIAEISDAEVRNALYDQLNVGAGVFAVRNKNWDEVEKRAEKLSNKTYKALLYLKALSAFDSGTPQNLMFDYLVRADKNIAAISDKPTKAAAQSCYTSLVLSLEKSDNFRDVPATIGAINQAPNFAEDYLEDLFLIQVKIPPKGITFSESIGKGSFRTIFTKLAEKDWNDSQLQALQIKSPGLQAIAQIATAKAALQKIKSTK